MDEPVIDPKVPQTTVTTEKPDWYINTLNKQIPDTLPELHEMGVPAAGFTLSSPEDAWSKDSVRKAFTDEQGNIRKDLFDSSYSQAAKKYKNYRDAELATVNADNQYADLTSKKLGIKLQQPIVYEANPDSQGRTYQSGYSFTDEFSGPQKSRMQSAISAGVLQSDGSFLHPKDFSGRSKIAMDDKGVPLLDKNGSSYLVPVKDGESLHSWDSVYSPFADKYGNYDYGHDYSFGSIVGLVLKNPINFFNQSIDDLIEYPRAIMNLTGFGGEKGEKKLNNIEQWAKSNIQPTSEVNQNKTFSLEGISDMSQQVIYQLGAMAAIGAGVTALTRNPKVGSAAAMGFMAMISAGSAQESARDNGLSKKEAALHMGLLTAAMYPLAGLSEVALGRLGGKESVAALKKTIAEATNNGILIKEAVKEGATNAAKKNVAMRVADAVGNWAKAAGEKIPSTVFKGLNTSGFLTSALAESMEEVSEQFADIVNREGYNLFSDHTHDFKFDLNNEMAKIGQSALGGAIGGPVAHGLFSKWLGTHPGVAHNMADMVADGKADKLRAFADSMWKQGRLDHDWMTTTGEITKPGQGASRNDEAHNVLTGVINFLEETYKGTGLNDLYKNNKEHAKALFADVLKLSSVGKDASALNTSLIDLTAQLATAQASPTPSPEAINVLKNKIELTQKSLAKIVRGDFVADYVTEGLYNYQSAKDSDLSQDILTGKEFNSLVNHMPDLHKIAGEMHKAEKDAQDARDTAATTTSFEGASGKRTDELVTEHEAAYSQAVQNLASHQEELSSLRDEDGEQVYIPENLASDNPSTIDKEMVVMRNSIPNLKSDEAKAAVTALIGLGESRSALLKYKKTVDEHPVEKPSPLPIDALLKMTSGSGALIESSHSSIPDKINEEILKRNEDNKGGNNLYTNTEKLNGILDSIQKRIAQAKALMVLTPQLNHSRELHKGQKLPDLKVDDIHMLLSELEHFEGVVNNLLLQSKDNAASADLRIRQAVSGLLGKTSFYLDNLSTGSIGTAWAGINSIVSSSRAELYDAIQNAEVAKAQGILTDIETKIYDGFKQNADTILDGLSKQPYSEDNVRTYDYVRGILSLSSTDFWNAFSTVLDNSAPDSNSPSDEHSIIVKQTVQGLYADAYHPPLWGNSEGQLAHPQRVLHHNSAFVEGRGRTGKTSTLIPLISGTVQTLAGGKVFLTAAADGADAKRSGLIAAMNKFYKQNDNKIGINLKSSREEILSFMSNPQLVSDVNLIVYDEATLLSSEELALIQQKLDEINNIRRTDPAKPSLLKIVYTGDTLQNSVGMDKSNPDSRALGIDEPHRHVIQRTPSLTFSFSQTNQQLTSFSSYLEQIQKDSGPSKLTFTSEYKGHEGVRVENTYDAFISNAVTYIGSLVKQSRLSEAVYITDKSPLEIDQRITSSGILVITSELAQGREWPIVFFDPKNDTLFDDKYTNLGVKKDYYTGATRASSFLSTHIAVGQGVSSIEGSVNKVKPLSPENSSKENAQKKVSEILGNRAKASKPVSFDSRVTIVKNSDALFSDEEIGKPIVANNFVPALPIATKPVVQSVVSYLTQSNRPGLVSGMSFYTDELRGFDSQMELKRKYLFDEKARKTTPYFLTIARNGSPGYANVLRNDPSFKGSYGVFVEAGHGKSHVVLFTMSTPELDAEIEKNDLLGGNESVRIPLNGDFLNEAESLAPTTFNEGRKTGGKGVVRSLGEFKAGSKGIYSGSPRIITVSNPDINSAGKSKSAAGSIVLPISFVKKKNAIDSSLAKNKKDDYVSFVGVRTKKLSVKEITKNLEKYVDPKTGEYNYTGDNGLSGMLHSAMWEHLTETGFYANGDVRPSLLSRELRKLRQNSTDAKFNTFLDKYIIPEHNALEPGQQEKLIALIKKAEGTNAAYDSEPGELKRVDPKGKFFFVNFLKAHVLNKKADLEMFFRAFEGLRGKGQYFEDGFEFNPRIEAKSTDVAVNIHAKAQDLPEDIYNKYLEVEGDFASPPVIRFPLNRLIQAMQDSVPQVTPPAEKTGKSKKTASVQTAEGEEPSSVLGQSPVEYGEISQSSSQASEEDGKSQSDTNYQEPKFEEEVDSLISNTVSLQQFQSAYFSKPGYSSMFIPAIREFKRDFMDYLFSVNAEGGLPGFLRDINEVVKNIEARSRQVMKDFPAKMIEALDPVSNADHAEVYKKYVKAKEFRFLMSKYFPVLKKVDSNWKYVSTHFKQRSFEDKDSFDLLSEGMTDMVKTHIYNTPLLEKTSDGWKSAGGFIWEGDIESLVNIAQSADSNSKEAFSEKLKTSNNKAAVSLHQRFFASEPYLLDGKMTWPIGKIGIQSIGGEIAPSMDIYHMANAIQQFVRSGAIFDLTKVDLDEQRIRLAWGPYGTPNTVRENSIQSMNQVALEQWNNINVNKDDSVIFGAITMFPSKVRPSTDSEVIEAIHAMGLSVFTQGNLEDLQRRHFDSFAIDKNSEGIAQKVNNKIMDDMVIPTFKKMKAQTPYSTRQLNVLYDAIIRTSNTSNIMMDTTVDGTKASRIRYGSPLYSINQQLDRIRDHSKGGVGSVLENNMLVNNYFKIEKSVIKSGFRTWKEGNSVKGLGMSEMADFDVLWSFAHVLADNHKGTGKYDTAVLTPLVWSDSGTDAQCIVRVEQGYFQDHNKIAEKLYNSRKDYWERMSSHILNIWNEFLGDGKVTTLQGLKAKLTAGKFSVSDVEKHPGMVNNLMYTSVDGVAAIKQSVLEDFNFYTGRNFKEFISKMNDNFIKFLGFAKEAKDSNGISLEDRVANIIEGKSGEQILRAFYYNWAAFSTEFSNVAIGPTQQYKGQDAHSEYIDSVKRNKLFMTNRTSMVYRNESWKIQAQKMRDAGIPLSDEMRYEGKKLPENMKVAYVHDIRKDIVLPSGLNKSQEIYDGATFVSPLTRIFQRYSNSGNHGMYVGSVMKNLTYNEDKATGLPSYIKNAEFMITPELLRKGTSRTVNLVKRMLMGRFDRMITGEKGNVGSALEHLYSLGVSEDFSNIEWNHFEQLADFLVDNGQQDSVIWEVAPDSSVKTGRGATNELDPVDAQGNPSAYIASEKNHLGKGTQLDASHGIDEIKPVSASQLINAMASTWPSDASSPRAKSLVRLYTSLAKIADLKAESWIKLSDSEQMAALRKMLVSAMKKRPDISYSTRVTADDNKGNFSIDDRQLIGSLIQNMTSSLTDEAIMLDYAGGQYIVHPADGLFEVYDVTRPGKQREPDIKMTVFKNELLPAEKEVVKGRNLAYNRADGYAEIVLPASMRKKFGITDEIWKEKKLTFNDITPELFLSLQKGEKDIRKANSKYRSFVNTTHQLVTRVPATGMHSGMASKIIGFMDESENSIFVPAEMLFVQGADQDVDKGTNFSYEIVNGYTPKVDENFVLLDKDRYKNKEEEALIAGIKNSVVASMEHLLTIPETLVERNQPVDVAKKELSDIAETRERTSSFDRDNYLSHMEMREINQAGMDLRGIFSFAMKGYQVMIASYRSMDIDPKAMGMETDEKVSQRLGALVNAAIDNAKDQLLGNLGIGTHNANIVSYLVIKGWSFRAIVDYLDSKKKEMDQMRAYQRYDSPERFRADQVWEHDKQLASYYYLGNETSRIASFVLNRAMPSGDTELIAYRKSVESFINGQYKAMGEAALDFRLIPFLENPQIRKQQTAKYNSLLNRENKQGIKRAEFNVLQMFSAAPHIASYMNIYSLANKLASISKLYKMSSDLADKILAATSQLDDRSLRTLGELKDFTYGLFIDQYYQSNYGENGDSLETPEERQEFIRKVASEEYKNQLSAKYPGNSFVENLTIVPDKKRGWDDSSLLRISQDLRQMSEEARMQMQADFAAMDDIDRLPLVDYNLITRQSKFGKDSFGSLFSPADKANFTEFLNKELSLDSFDMQKMADLFTKFKEGGLKGDWNSIPYSGQTQAKIEEKVKPVQIAESKVQTLSLETVRFINGILQESFPEEQRPNLFVDRDSSLDFIYNTTKALMSSPDVEGSEKAYLSIIIREIENREKVSEKEVIERLTHCLEPPF